MSEKFKRFSSRLNSLAASQKMMKCLALDFTCKQNLYIYSELVRNMLYVDDDDDDEN